MKLRAVFDDLMRKHHRQAVLLGAATASTPEEFFGFHHRHVKTVHFHMQGVGAGVWFRLHCGRVIDEVARVCAGDHEVYDHGVWA